MGDNSAFNDLGTRKPVSLINSIDPVDPIEPVAFNVEAAAAAADDDKNVQCSDCGINIPKTQLKKKYREPENCPPWDPVRCRKCRCPPELKRKS